MIRALWTSASGLMSQQVAVDAIANNIANVNTTAFKRNNTQFQDLFYQQGNALGEFEPETSSRTGITFGTGVKVASTNKQFSQGRLEQTGSPLDLAIQGEGFFKVQLPDGTYAYTRDGSFTVDKDRKVVTPQGYELQPSLIIPEGSKDLFIEPNGIIRATLQGAEGPSEIGRISLFTAVNPAGMYSVGENAFAPTVAAGAISEIQPDSESAGSIQQGFLEGSNMELADEMTQLVVAQRSYQMSAQAFKNAEEMLSIATNIRG